MPIARLTIKPEDRPDDVFGRVSVRVRPIGQARGRAVGQDPLRCRSRG
jgi:hypothetical protein